MLRPDFSARSAKESYHFSLLSESFLTRSFFVATGWQMVSVSGSKVPSQFASCSSASSSVGNFAFWQISQIQAYDSGATRGWFWFSKAFTVAAASFWPSEPSELVGVFGLDFFSSEHISVAGWFVTGLIAWYCLKVEKGELIQAQYTLHRGNWMHRVSISSIIDLLEESFIAHLSLVFAKLSVKFSLSLGLTDVNDSFLQKG